MVVEHSRAVRAQGGKTAANKVAPPVRQGANFVDLYARNFCAMWRVRRYQELLRNDASNLSFWAVCWRRQNVNGSFLTRA